MPSESRIIRTLPPQAFAPGKMAFDLDKLQVEGYRIDALFVELDGTANVPAAGLTSDQQTRLLDAVESERRLNGDGLGMSALDWQQCGKDFVRPAAIAVNAAAPIHMVWPIGWRDERAIEPTDHSPAVAFYSGKTLNLYWAKPTDILAALAINAGTTVQVTAHLSALSEGSVPTSVVIGYAEGTGKELKLPAGQYVDIIVQKLDGAAITEAEMGNMTLSEDNRWPVIDRQRLPALVRSFNRYVAKGSQVQGATDGVEGEAIDEAAVPFVPVLHPMQGFKGTKLPTAKSNMWLLFDGTLAAGSFRVYYRMLELRDEDNVLRAAERIGYDVDRSQGATPKTASKNGVNPVRGLLSGIAQRVKLRKRRS
jgi:hypothetical protein